MLAVVDVVVVVAAGRSCGHRSWKFISRLDYMNVDKMGSLCVCGAMMRMVEAVLVGELPRLQRMVEK